MKDKLFHLTNKGSDSLESFVLVFLCTCKHGSLQVLSRDP